MISKDERTGSVTKLKDLRWLLIDEFQDFSDLQFRLIDAMRCHNPHLKVFCVGDDWQAINGYAGAKTKYIQDFERWFPGGKRAHLLHNRRSKRKIVDTGNRIMASYPPLAKPILQAADGRVDVSYLDDIRIDITQAGGADQRYRLKDYDDDFVAARTLKAVHEIPRQTTSRGKTIVVLSRTNRLHDVELKQYKDKLQLVLDVNTNVLFRTIHSYKGLEADITVLANTCKYSLPLVHPEYVLQTLFYANEKEALEQLLAEELRLFYVASSRAKDHLIFLTRENEESEYLEQAGMPVRTTSL